MLRRTLSALGLVTILTGCEDDPRRDAINVQRILINQLLPQNIKRTGLDVEAVTQISENEFNVENWYQTEVSYPDGPKVYYQMIVKKRVADTFYPACFALRLDIELGLKGACF